MPKRKRKPNQGKPAVELTKDEAMERVLGKEITEAARRVAHQKDPVDAPSDSHKESVS